MKNFRPLPYVFMIFLSSRILCGLFVYLGHAKRIATGSRPVGGWVGVDNWWLNPWTTYDSLHFVNIARDGYQDFLTPFFPLYPCLLKLGGSTETGMVITGILFSNIFFLAALWLVFKVTELDLGCRSDAKAVVWFIAFFPTTAFFSAVYTESLFLFFLAACFLCARKQRWLLAGILGMGAALTRNPGFLISLALMADYCNTHSWHPNGWKRKDILAVSLPLIAFLGVQTYFGFLFGDASAGVSSQEIYFRQLGWPWEPIWHDLKSILMNPRETIFIGGTHVLFTVLAFVLVWIARNKLPLSYLILILGVMLMHLTFYRIPYPQTIGTVRYLSTLFPFSQAFIFAGQKLTPQFRKVLVGLNFYLCFIFSYGFGLKGFLG